MKHEAIIELRNISKVGNEHLREELLEHWIDRWLVETKFTQSVVSTKYLTSEYDDIIKTRMAQSMAEDLSENCVDYKVSDRNISASMMAFRRKGK